MVGPNANSRGALQKPTAYVQEFYGIEMAPVASGVTVVIDVLRAFTTAAYAFAGGVREIYLVATAQEAFDLKRAQPELILVGEEGGVKIEGFDYGNSPETIESLDLKGRRLVLRSSSGTQGVVQAKDATKIFLGSLVVASATVRAVQSLINAAPANANATSATAAPSATSDATSANPATAAGIVTLLAMGSPHGPDKEEDLACRDFMAALFRGESLPHAVIQKRVIESPAGQQALDPKIDFKTPGDLDRAIAIDRFNFSMPVTFEKGHLIARAEPPLA